MFDRKKHSVINVNKHSLFGLNSSIVITLVLICPILFTVILYPSTFNLSWNEGRGGFLFAMAFIAAELIGINYNIPRKRFYIVIVLSGITIGYFIALSLGLTDVIRSVAPYYHVHLVDSWIWMWDFVIMSIYAGSSLIILFGRRWYKIAPAGVIYLAGSAAILSLDAFFPYNSLGFLQFVVPIYLQIDQVVIQFIDNYILDVGPGMPATAHDNLLLLNGLHGPFALQVFWPSAGVHSMIIYTLVMLAFLLKMEIPYKRKIIYFVLGTIGTVTVNVIRIISLSMFALVVTTNASEWEAFHSIAGEIMFLPWLGIYLALVMYLESKRRQKLQSKPNMVISTNRLDNKDNQQHARTNDTNDKI